MSTAAATMPIRLLFLATGILWMSIGLSSQQAPLLPLSGWVMLMSLPAGTSFAVVHHVTRSSLRWYVGSVVAVSSFRAAAYMVDGVVGSIPSIWALIVAHALIILTLVVIVLEDRRLA